MARPRSFDETEAVEKALALFTAKGYDGTSVADLTAAIGIKPASLYTAFGDKRGLFDRALDLYAARRAPLVQTALAQPTIAGVVDRLLHNYADALTHGDLARGCLYVQGALAGGDASESVKHELARRRLSIEPELEQRFRRAVVDGELDTEADCGGLARYVATLLQGMAVQASGGVDADALHAVARVVSAQFEAMTGAVARKRF